MRPAECIGITDVLKPSPPWDGYNRRMQTPHYESFDELLRAQDPTAEAFRYIDSKGEQITLTFSEFLAKVDSFSIPDAFCIGLMCDSSIEMVCAFFALARAKRRIVMLSPAEEEKTLLSQVRKTHVEAVLGPGKELFDGILSPVTDGAGKEGNILFFTSGTTSANRAVMLTERSLCSSAYNGGYLLPLSKKDRMLSLLPLSHVFGFVCCLLWPLSFGACVCLGRGMRHLIDDPLTFKPTVMSLVPQLAGFLATKKLINSECKLILIGAGACKRELLAFIESLGIRVCFGYGLTETSSGVALAIGEDKDAMTVCPEAKITLAEDGEILIEAPTCMFQGYFEDEAATKAIYDGRVLKTGDLGRFDEQGKLHIVGRKKDILLLDDGTKIFCPEYEAELAPYIQQEDFAVALSKGKVVLHIGKCAGDLHLEEKIDAFNLTMGRNRQIVAVQYHQQPLPRTQTGKIKRYLLSEE